MTGENVHPGGRVGHDDPRYPMLVRGFNLRWVGTARYVEPCGSAVEWVRGFYEAMYGADGPLPDAVMDGCYVNYPDIDLVRCQELYHADGYPKLQQVKAAWDPGDVFNHRLSVELPRSV